MLKIGKTTNKTPAQVLAAAEEFFGETGLGLKKKEHGPTSVGFEGSGGFVSVTISGVELRHFGSSAPGKKWDRITEEIRMQSIEKRKKIKETTLLIRRLATSA